MYDPFSHFLRKSPRPVSLKTDTGHAIKVGSTGSWIKAARETLDGLAWGRVDALDSTGAIIRSLASDADEAPAETLESISSEPTIAIAQLLNKAADQACERQAQAYEMSMDRFLGLVQLVLGRLVQTEELVSKMQLERAQLLQQAIAEPDADGGLGQMVASAFGLAQKAPATPPSGGNGAGGSH